MSEIEQLSSELTKELHKFDCIKSCSIQFSKCFVVLYHINKTNLQFYNNLEHDFDCLITQGLLIEADIKHTDWVAINNLLENFYRKHHKIFSPIENSYNQFYVYEDKKELV